MSTDSQHVTHTHPSASRMLPGAALLAAACLLAPVHAHAQSVAAERAMRNVSASGTFSPATATATATATTAAVVPAWTVDGAYALLGASQAATWGTARLARASTEAVRSVDGASALLNRVSLPGRKLEGRTTLITGF